MTTYEYEGERLVRAVTVREREYTEADLSALLKLALESPLGPHGVPMDEATSAELKDRWHVPEPLVDFVSQKLKAAKAEYLAKYPNADPDDYVWQVRKRPR